MRLRFTAALLVVAPLVAQPWSASAYVGKPPPTLGELCRQADHVFVLQVEDLSREKGVILFKAVEKLKAKTELPDGVLDKQVIGPKVAGAKIILDGAGKGKKAVLFSIIATSRDGVRSRFPGAGYVYIDNYWYLAGYDPKRECWTAVSGEPVMLSHYCGTPEKLAEVVPKILAGQEVVVSAMVGGNMQDLENRRGKVREVRASLKPDLLGKITALSEDGKRLTLAPDPTRLEKAPAAVDIKIDTDTRIIALVKNNPAKLAVGAYVRIWLEMGDDKTAATVQIGRPR